MKVIFCIFKVQKYWTLYYFDTNHRTIFIRHIDISELTQAGKDGAQGTGWWFKQESEVVPLSSQGESTPRNTWEYSLADSNTERERDRLPHQEQWEKYASHLLLTFTFKPSFSWGDFSLVVCKCGIEPPSTWGYHNSPSDLPDSSVSAWDDPDLPSHWELIVSLRANPSPGVKASLINGAEVG